MIDDHDRLRELTQDEFAAFVRGAYLAGTLRSSIGYQQTAALIERLAGVPIPVSRDQTEVADGDTMLICQPRGSAADPRSKGDPVPEDFAFFTCAYSYSAGKE